MTIFSFKTDIGKVGEKNEDAFGFWLATRTTEGSFFVVADGLGGMPAGEIAAQMAVEKAIEGFSLTKNIKRAFVFANQEIYRKSEVNPDYFGMCTTLVGVVIDKKYATIGNVGDSRAYFISQGKISQITQDHSLGMNIVTRVLGINPEVEVDIFKKDLQKNDLLLLCTDGLTNMISDSKILEILKDIGKTQEELDLKANRLIKAANQAGGIDNITVCLITA